MNSTERVPRRGLLSVDGAGEYLLLHGPEIILGHSQGAEADLGFLADVGPRHARLRRRDSFRDGPRWEIAPLRGEPLTVAGRPLGEDGVRLEEGDELRLGRNLVLHYRLPDPASHTVLLELAPTCSSCGPRRFLLLGEGEGGRVRIGAGENRHVRVPSLEEGVTFRLRDERLDFLADGAAPSEGVSLPFPPKARIDLTLGRLRRPEGRRPAPPFGLAVSPHPRGA